MERPNVTHIGKWTAIAFAVIIGVYIATAPLAASMERAYANMLGTVTIDRNGEVIAIDRTQRGYFVRPFTTVPGRLAELLVRKEDRFFFWHLGVNPLSIARDIAEFPFTRKLRGSSTITQQLAKILLGHETDRSLKNKLIETLYAFSLELHTSKSDILRMYANSAYFGNQAQGVEEASYYYFGIPAASLTDPEIIRLLTALNAPSGRFPGTFKNSSMAQYLASSFGIEMTDAETSEKMIAPREPRTEKAALELRSLGDCKGFCRSTIDLQLTENLRELLRKNLASPSFESVENGAIVVIKLPENEILAVVGSPDPDSAEKGAQINMAVEPRSIGSTAKPFIYSRAFEKGARPYTLVDDREYKYEIASGFPFYPKNFDGRYRGLVTLHTALSNSLNVPSVKVLEFVGGKPFYAFMESELGFTPVQPLENYGLGIALGSLEMDLLTLSHYFTIFPNGGVLKPLTSYDAGEKFTPLMEKPFDTERRVLARPITELITKILSDRETSIEQFGLKSNLNLAQNNYALKTGTSRDYHDSWTMGYTPDYVIGVWLGNSRNVAMRQVTGQTGAGKIWHEAMDMLINSQYNKKTPFVFDNIKEFSNSGTIEYGLVSDDYAVSRNIMREDPLVLSPHEGDTFLLEGTSRIPLTASEPVEWTVNGSFIGRSDALDWTPREKGVYSITGKGRDREETMQIRVTDESDL